ITKSKTVEIIKELISLYTYAANYRKEKQKWLDDKVYAEHIKKEKMEALDVAYLQRHQKAKERMLEILGAILEAENVNDSILEYDVPEFAKTVSVIHASAGKLPLVVLESIKHNFAGQYQVLETIGSLFEHYGIDLDKVDFADYVQPAFIKLEALQHNISNLEQSEVSVCVYMKQIKRDLLNFCSVRGITFTDEELKELDFSIDDEMETAIARQEMGLK
ncbi:MAG: hypothetical protein IJ367_04565, partial [Clostridia bacterium]|nr:hypothetical protein [Clostridia bacterium]